jgi:hypothetical protein
MPRLAECWSRSSEPCKGRYTACGLQACNEESLFELHGSLVRMLLTFCQRGPLTLTHYLLMAEFLMKVVIFSVTNLRDHTVLQKHT